MDTLDPDWATLFANGKSPTKGSVHDAFVLLRWLSAKPICENSITSPSSADT